jgi:hypothetical protein
MLNSPLWLSGEALPSRQRIERIIDNLIALLDETDPDPDEEPVGDDEPSLGWISPCDRRAGYVGGCSDLEQDDAESGCADWDGMVEQWGGTLQIMGGTVE